MDLATRMKEYEKVSDVKLIKRMPVIVRIDGKAFHTFTRGFDKPYDYRLSLLMKDLAEYLLKNVQNCVLAYTQSDEVSLVLNDYKTLETDALFDNRVQKIVSVIASQATARFNEAFYKTFASDEKFFGKLFKVNFDCRAFNISSDELENYLLWRQRDCKRNTISSYGRYFLTHRAIQGKNSSQIIEMLKEKGVDIEDIPSDVRYGILLYKSTNDSSHIFTFSGNLYEDITRDFIRSFV